MPLTRERSVASVRVVADAEGLPSRTGTAPVVSLADRVGLAAALQEARTLLALEDRPPLSPVADRSII